ncbi:hypothetical protein IIY59_01545 [Candidatus Saccharibacteria bacterium]|nr:hypothetical protein [Candidatus Saccharibacteria bacterium]
MKQKVLMIIALIIFLGIGLLCGNEIGKNRNSLATLPKPELSEGQRGELGIDKNINEENIDAYLGRSDSVYYDMRMLIDPANYSAIGGDSYLSGYVRGFEVIPYPLLTNVEGLPEAVGKSYSGDTLFTNKNGKFTANYKESKQIIQDLFPKDKNIFLMCGGGGYAGMTKDMLVKMGWDKDKIYVVGGYWYYSGKNNVEVKQKNDDGKDYYAFWKIPYHDLDFSKLTKN